MRNIRGSPSSGFNLVEVSLAIVVMSVAIFAAISLYFVSTEQSGRAIGQSQAALFAEEVFSGLRGQAETNWNNLGNYPLPVAAAYMWDQPSNMNMNTLASGCVRTGLYCFGSNAEGVAFEDHAFRYMLIVTNVSYEDLKSSPVLKHAILQVWSGQFGSLTNAAYLYYTEFFNMSAWTNQ